MPSSYTRNLRLEKPATGELAGSWGQVANKDYDFLDIAIDGNVYINIGGGYNLDTAQEDAASNGRNKVIVWTGSLLATATINITPDNAEKLYFMTNATAGGFGLKFTQGTGGSFTLGPGASAIIYCDGAGITAKVDGANYSPQFGSVILQGQMETTSLMKAQANDVHNNIQFWKDGPSNPSAAVSIGMDVPSGPITNDLIFCTYVPSTWTERLRIKGAGSIDVQTVLNTLQRQVAVSNIVGAGFGAAAIEIRETNQVAGAQTEITYAPRISFNWLGRAQMQLGMDSVGILKSMNLDGTLGPFQCSVLSVSTVNANLINASGINADAINVSTGSATISVTTLNATTITVTTANVTTLAMSGAITGLTTLNVTTVNATTLNGNLVGTWAGRSISAGSAPGANQVIAADASAQVYFGWINTVSGDNGTAGITRVYASNDPYLRYYTLQNFANQIKLLIPSSSFTTQNTFNATARVVNTNYPNSSGRAMMVCATFAVNPGGQINVMVDAGATPTTQIAIVIVSGGASVLYTNVTFTVLPGHNYRFNFISGPASVYSVTEWT